MVNIHKRPIWAQRPTFFQIFSSDSDSSSHFTLSMNWIWKNMPRNKKFWINMPNFEIPPTLLLSSLEQNFYFSILLFYSWRAWKMLNKLFLKYEFWRVLIKKKKCAWNSAFFEHLIKILNTKKGPIFSFFNLNSYFKIRQAIRIWRENLKKSMP